MNRFSSFSALVSLAFIGLACPTQAYECFSPSPRFSQQQNTYYQLEAPTPVAAADKNAFQQAVAQLPNRLMGEGQRMECVGTEKNPRVTHQGVKIRAQLVGTDQAALKLQMEFEDLKNRDTQVETWLLLGKDAVFNFKNQGQGRYFFIQKARLRNAASSQDAPKTSLQESEVSVQFTGNGVNLTINRFNNGVYTGQDVVRLGGK